MICTEKILFIIDAENQQKFLIKNYFLGIFIEDTEFHSKKYFLTYLSVRIPPNPITSQFVKYLVNLPNYFSSN